MRRFLLLLAVAVVLVSGVVVTAAQTPDVQTEEEDPGAQGAGCTLPVASPGIEPAASPSLALASTPIAVTEGSPAVLEVCATPEVGTPAA